MKTTVVLYGIERRRILAIDGHSDCDAGGFNPVCACVSALVTSLWFSLPERYRINVEVSPGHARFDVEPNEKDAELICLLFAGVLEALRVVEREFPEYINIIKDILP